jgi:hypothetical protein
MNATRANMLRVPTTTVPIMTSCRRPDSSSWTRVAEEVGLAELDGVIEVVRVGDSVCEVVGVMECDGDSEKEPDGDSDSVGVAVRECVSDSVRDWDLDSVTVFVLVRDSESLRVEESDHDALPLPVSENEIERDWDADGVPVRLVAESFIDGVTITDFEMDDDLVRVKHCTPAHENSFKVLARVYGTYATGLIRMPRRPSKAVQASCRT